MEYKSKVLQKYLDGNFNAYCADSFVNMLDDGMSDELFDVLSNDWEKASKWDVNSELDYKDYFLINHIVDDILEDTFDVEINPAKMEELKKFIFDNRNDYNLSSFLDLRMLIHKWLVENYSTLNKKAYPNVGGVHERQNAYDIGKWITAIKAMDAMIKNGMDKEKAFELYTNTWDKIEKEHFRYWLSYYEQDTMNKYNIKQSSLKKSAFGFSGNIPEEILENRNQLPPNPLTTLENTRKQNNEKAKSLRRQMLSRINSIRKLLLQYNELSPNNAVHDANDAMISLEKNIMKLRSEASVKDMIVRTAGMINKNGFKNSADELLKLADQPAGNLPSGNKAGVMKKLEEISEALKTRRMVKELYSIDHQLSEMGMGSYFPEISDSMSKLIEAYGYAGNKVDSVLSKLRGGETKKEAPQQTNTPQQSTNQDLLNRPMGVPQNRLPQ